MTEKKTNGLIHTQEKIKEEKHETKVAKNKNLKPSHNNSIPETNLLLPRQNSRSLEYINTKSSRNRNLPLR